MSADPRDEMITLDSSRGRTVLATVILGSAVAALTSTVVNVALPTLARDLDASSAGLKWIVNSYTLTLAALILIGGSLGDRYGRIRVYRLGVSWFALASLLCAFAWDVNSMIAFRLLQGIGGALLTPGSLAIIESSLRQEDRGRGVGAWSGISGVAGAIGPLVGGLLVEVSWRWVFVINLPVAVGVLVLSRWVPETRDTAANESDLDWFGAVLVVLALGGISYALIEGPESDLSALEIGVAVAGIGCVVGLWLHERGRRNAMVPVELFANRTFSVANVLTFVVYGGMGVLFFLLTVHLQVTSGWTPLKAGTALLPVTVILLVLSSRMGDVATRIGPRWPLTIGPIVAAIGMVMLTRVGVDASFGADVLPAVVVFGLGLSAIVAPVTTAALGSVPDERAGAASGVNNAVARTAGLLAVAAIPGLVGLTGDALGDPELLGPGFDRAMWMSAIVVASGGAVAFFFLPAEAPTADLISEGRHQHPCPVDGSLSSIRPGLATAD